MAPKILAHISGSTFRQDPVTLLINLHLSHGDIVAIELDGMPTAIFGGVRGAQALFDAEREHLSVYNTPAIHELFRRAIFNLAGHDHRHARKYLQRALTGPSLGALASRLTQLVEDHINASSEKEAFDLHAWCRALTLDFCARLLIGLPKESKDEIEFSALFRDFVAATEVDTTDHASLEIHQRGVAAAEGLRRLISCRAEMSLANPTPDVLSNLVRLNVFCTSDLADHLLACMIAARETTASLLAWTLISLASAQKTVIGNCAAAGMPSSTMANSQIQNLLWEVQRRHSPNILSCRTVTSKFKTPFGSIPTGWCAAYSPAVNHLLPEFTKDPMCFQPRRFAVDGGRRKASKLLTFGRGLHACPGKKFAELAASTLVVSILRAHHIKLLGQPLHQVRYFPVKTPARPVWAQIIRRSSS